jgi:elongator complex protein 3
MARAMTLEPAVPTSLPVPTDRADLEREKLRWIRDGLEDHMLSNSELLARAAPENRVEAARVLRRKPSRTLSGVAIVAVMTAPAACPHGKCTYCPGGLDNRSPQSYTGEEPSALRGAQLHYDARAITAHRLNCLETIGHSTSKVEVILMGGTFPARPASYRRDVFRGVFEGLNDAPAASLEDAQRLNETAPRRCVSLTVETRPDWCDGRILPQLLDSGVTRVEIGVECLTDSVLWATGRAHGTTEIRRATREARDRGLKVCYHWMLGLPGMDPARDLRDFRTLFEDPAYRPDMLKIYPTLVVPGTQLYGEWKAGRYSPYETDTAAELLATEKAELPPYVRIQRIQRDIPARLIAAGVRHGNLREIARARLRVQGLRCRCLRCREPGRGPTPDPSALELRTQTYSASGGTEEFFTWEDPLTDTVAGFLRLRFPGTSTEGGLDAPVVRELKVLGLEVPVASAAHAPVQYQHRGLGRSLLEAAEQSTRSAGYRRLYVLSAVGTREYYRNVGFETAGPWMSKVIRG